MLVEQKKKRSTAALVVSLAILVLMITPACLAIQQPQAPASHEQHFRVLSLGQPPTASNQSADIELGYGPSSLAPVSERLPVYAVGDELWLESNYNYTIRADLEDSQGNIIRSAVVSPTTITDVVSFDSSLATQQLTLAILANCNTGCQEYPYTIQFVNPGNDAVGSLVSHYSISNSTLSISLASPALSDKFDIEQCLSSVASDSEVQVPLPSTFGGGYVGVVGDPATGSATIVASKTTPSTPFAFSFELLGNYTYLQPNSNASSNPIYTSSELEVAQSDSVLVQRGGQPNATTALSTLAPLRGGRYILRATFQSSNGYVQVNTPLLVGSPSSSTWFWLGGCLELNGVSPTFTSQINLSGPPGGWPRYLYLMYQAVPGIDGYANVSLALPLDRVRFVWGNKNATLPSDIGVSYVGNNSDASAIEDVVGSSGGAVYLVTNGSYPVRTTFALSFGGVTFDSSSVVLNSPYSEVLETVELASLQVLATENGRGLGNATVTIFSTNLNSSIRLSTASNGVAQTLVPPGNYTIYVESGGRTQPPVQDYFVAGSSYTIPVIFPGAVNYTSYLDWLVVAITIIGVVGNLWFWLAKRKIRKTLE